MLSTVFYDEIGQVSIWSGSEGHRVDSWVCAMGVAWGT